MFVRRAARSSNFIHLAKGASNSPSRAFGFVRPHTVSRTAAVKAPDVKDLFCQELGDYREQSKGSEGTGEKIHDQAARTFGWRTVPEGKRLAVYRHDGELDIIKGPDKVILKGEKSVELKRYVVDPSQYLNVVSLDGSQTYTPGPTEMWFDPVTHHQVSVESAVAVNANECLVLYRQHASGESGTAKFQRRILKGPCLYSPSGNEWMHQFSWHGADVHHPSIKVPGALRFTHLRLIPDQFYFNVESVRTVDDALLTVELMIFWELKEINTMLDATHDAVAVLMNAITADVIEYSGKLSFEQFKDGTDKLNQTQTYPQLLKSAERIGYSIGNVVFRGYKASATLQQMHDEAIETRTRLQLETETSEQEENLADFKLNRNAERDAIKRDLREKEELNQQKLEKIKHDEQMRAKQKDLQLQIAHQNAQKQHEVKHIKNLKNEGVDVTEFLLHKYQRLAKIIKFDGSSPSQPQVHVHDENNK